MTTSVCSGAGFTVTPVNSTNGIVPAGTTYSWPVPSGAGFSGGASGSGASNISGTLTNNGTLAFNGTLDASWSTNTFDGSVHVNSGGTLSGTGAINRPVAVNSGGIMAGNLTTGIATKQALSDPDREDRYIGLLSGDYLMLPQVHTDELAKELPNLDLVQGFLVRKDADPNLPLQTRAQSAVPGITYASMRVSVQPLDASSASKPAPAAAENAPSEAAKSSSKKGKK